MKENLSDYPNISKCIELNSRVWQSATFPSELTHKEIFLMQSDQKIWELDNLDTVYTLKMMICYNK